MTLEHGSGQLVALEHGSGQVVALEHGSGQFVALEHGSEAETEFGTGSLWRSCGGSVLCEISNPPSFLYWRYSEVDSWSAT